MTHAALTQARESVTHPLIGKRSRVGVVGQEYEIVRVADPSTALISVATWDELLPYPIAEIELDLAGVCDKARFQPLVGQYRTIGPDGPTYKVESIVDEQTAEIWIVGEDEDEHYRIGEILLDPLLVD